MQVGHRSRAYASAEAMSDHHGIALAKGIDKPIKLREIVAVVGVRHDDEASSCASDAAEERAAVALLRDMNHACSGAARKFRRSIRGTVIRHENLSVDPGALQETSGLPHAGHHRLGFVQARHENRQLEAPGFTRRMVRRSWAREAGRFHRPVKYATIEIT